MTTMVIEDRCTNPTSIVIPAHNEQDVLARLLSKLLDGAAPREFEIVVVCNGCTDGTAQIAAMFGSDVHVVEVPQPSKRDALRRGDAEASHLPRLYIDADVEIGYADIRALVAALSTDILAAAPSRVIPREHVAALVRGYYDVWEQLPHVRGGLFARGVIALSAAGYARTSRLPQLMSDDLAMSEAFAAEERAVVAEATVIVHPPRTWRDLIRRRIRISTGNTQFDQVIEGAPRRKATCRDLVRIAYADPRLILRLPIFVVVTLISRLAARRTAKHGDFDTWLRDQSSRA
jgi:glycosyltransferase involved in cell wall biosynthesis